MKLVLCLAAAAALAACSSTPAPAKAAEAKPAAQAAAAKPAAAKVAAKDEGKQCTMASSIGSNMRKRSCTTQAEREKATADGKDSVDQFDKAVRAGTVAQ